MFQRCIRSGAALLRSCERTTGSMAPVSQRKDSTHGREEKEREQKHHIPDKIIRFKNAFSVKECNRNSAKRKILQEPTSYFSAAKVKRTVASFQKSAEESRDVKANFDLSLRPVNPTLAPLLVALDCEMVECEGRVSVLARCSVVDYFGNVLADVYVKPVLHVTDYRTKYSGITKSCLEGMSCVDLQTARSIVQKTVSGKILVGHSIWNDYRALEYRHPRKYEIDIASVSMTKILLPHRTGKGRFSLRHMADKLLKRTIQNGKHCSVEDARATIDLFRLVEDQWLSQNNDTVAELMLENNSGLFLDDKYWPDDIKNE